MKPTIPEAVVDGHSAEDFATSTQRVRAARAELVEATGGRLRISAIYGDTEVTLDLRDQSLDTNEASQETP